MRKNLKRRCLFFDWVFVMLIAVVIVPAALTQAKNPFAGGWKANLSKSQRDPNHLFKS